MRNVSHRLVTVPFLATVAAAQAVPADVQALAGACNRFAVDLHEALAPQGPPTASPASVAVALLMLLPGARGDTAAELATVLRLPAELRDRRLEAAARELLARLAHTGDDAAGPKLAIGNDLWTQEGYPVAAPYVALLRESFGAHHHAVRFREDHDAARTAINAHVAAATNQRIRELLSPGVVTADTRVILTNTVWLKAAWMHPFDASASAPRPFTLDDGTVTEVATMRLVESFGYADSDEWQCVAMPFAPGTLVAEFVLPRPGKPLAAAARALLAGECKPAREQVRVELPRFRTSGAYRLREVLQGLGLRAAFDAALADFTGITPQRELVLGDVVHQTWIQVDESGAEAAAATAAVMRAGAARPAEPKVFAANRPFAFVLRDRRTGLVLFFGRVDDPRRDAPPPAKER